MTAKWNKFKLTAVGTAIHGAAKGKVALDFYDMGLTVHAGKGLGFYDCMKHETVGI